VRVLSGIQPSGALHLGNYFAMMKRMIEYQKEHTLFCFIVNYHALTSVQDSSLLKRGTFEAACDFLALGIDPEKSYFWVQADVPEVTELTWLLSTVTPVGLLERAHSYKDKLAKGIAPNHGLFAYPVLMAADILCYGSDIIPVGKDQKQHVEMTRDIAIRFNNMFGDTFVIPKPDIPTEVAMVPGIDGQKMSKSYGNTIEIFTSKENLRKKVMSVVTDSTPVMEPKNPNKCILYALYSLFLSSDDREKLRDRYQTPGLKYSDIKKELITTIWEYFAPYREKREKFIQDRDTVIDILKLGAEKARGIASEYLTKARENMGLNY
jgi:tryptophanyl-tRNA synthetase